MKFTPNPKDIYLWADGYWCFRKDLYMQPRHNFDYELVPAGCDKWNAVCLESDLASPSSIHQSQPTPVFDHSRGVGGHEQPGRRPRLDRLLGIE